MDPDDHGARVLAHNVGFEIVEVGERVWFFDRRTRGPGLAAAISGGVAGITVINAVLLAVSELGGGELGGGWLAVAILVAVALAAALVCRASLRLRARRLGAPRASLRPLAIVDREARMVLDGDGRELAPVAEVRGGRGMLIGSSAPAVFIEVPGRRRIEIFRGSLWGGGAEPALEALAELGFSR